MLHRGRLRSARTAAKTWCRYGAGSSSADSGSLVGKSSGGRSSQTVPLTPMSPVSRSWLLCFARAIDFFSEARRLFFDLVEALFFFVLELFERVVFPCLLDRGFDSESLRLPSDSRASVVVAARQIMAEIASASLIILIPCKNRPPGTGRPLQPGSY